MQSYCGGPPLLYVYHHTSNQHLHKEKKVIFLINQKFKRATAKYIAFCFRGIKRVGMKDLGIELESNNTASTTI